MSGSRQRVPQRDVGLPKGLKPKETYYLEVDTKERAKLLLGALSGQSSPRSSRGRPSPRTEFFGGDRKLLLPSGGSSAAPAATAWSSGAKGRGLKTQSSPERSPRRAGEALVVKGVPSLPASVLADPRIAPLLSQYKTYDVKRIGRSVVPASPSGKKPSPPSAVGTKRDCWQPLSGSRPSEGLRGGKALSHSRSFSSAHSRSSSTTKELLQLTSLGPRGVLRGAAADSPRTKRLDSLVSGLLLEGRRSELLDLRPGGDFETNFPGEGTRRLSNSEQGGSSFAGKGAAESAAERTQKKTLVAVNSTRPLATAEEALLARRTTSQPPPQRRPFSPAASALAAQSSAAGGREEHSAAGALAPWSPLSLDGKSPLETAASHAADRSSSPRVGPWGGVFAESLPRSRREAAARRRSSRGGVTQETLDEGTGEGTAQWEKSAFFQKPQNAPVAESPATLAEKPPQLQQRLLPPSSGEAKRRTGNDSGQNAAKIPVASGGGDGEKRVATRGSELRKAAEVISQEAASADKTKWVFLKDLQSAQVALKKVKRKIAAAETAAEKLRSLETVMERRRLALQLPLLIAAFSEARQDFLAPPPASHRAQSGKSESAGGFAAAAEELAVKVSAETPSEEGAPPERSSHMRRRRFVFLWAVARESKQLLAALREEVCKCVKHLLFWQHAEVFLVSAASKISQYPSSSSEAEAPLTEGYLSGLVSFAKNLRAGDRQLGVAERLSEGLRCAASLKPDVLYVVSNVVPKEGKREESIQVLKELASERRSQGASLQVRVFVMRGGPLSPEEQEFFLQVQQTASEEGWGGEGEAESAGTLDGEARCNSETKNPTSGGDFAAEEKGHCVAGDFDKASLAYCTKAALKTRLYEAAEFLVEGQRRQSGFSFFALDWRGLVKSQTKDARMSQKLKTQLQDLREKLHTEIALDKLLRTDKQKCAAAVRRELEKSALAAKSKQSKSSVGRRRK